MTKFIDETIIVMKYTVNNNGRFAKFNDLRPTIIIKWERVSTEGRGRGREGRRGRKGEEGGCLKTPRQIINHGWQLIMIYN